MFVQAMHHIDLQISRKELKFQINLKNSAEIKRLIPFSIKCGMESRDTYKADKCDELR